MLERVSEKETNTIRTRPAFQPENLEHMRDVRSRFMNKRENKGEKRQEKAERRGSTCETHFYPLLSEGASE